VLLLLLRTCRAKLQVLLDMDSVPVMPAVVRLWRAALQARPSASSVQVLSVLVVVLLWDAARQVGWNANSLHVLPAASAGGGAAAACGAAGGTHCEGRSPRTGRA
jgi:hypothetical protein